MSKRVPVKKEVEDSILTACRRRCCLCAYLNGDYSEKQGQIAHIDRNAENSKSANLAFLCLPHHDRYDSKTSQSKGFTPSELSYYKGALEQWCRENMPQTPSQRLKIDAWPRWNARQFCLAIRAESRGGSPICLHMLSVTHRATKKEPNGITQMAVPNFRIILRQFDSTSFSIDMGNIKPSSVIDISLVDSEGCAYPLSPQNVERIRNFQNEYDELKKCLEIAGGGSNKPVFHDNSIELGFRAGDPSDAEGIVVRVNNKSGTVVHATHYVLEWATDISDEACRSFKSDVPQAVEVGAAISIQLGNMPLAPGTNTYIPLGGASVQFCVECVAKKVRPDQIKFSLILQEGWAIHLTDEGGITEAVRAVAVGREQTSFPPTASVQ